MPILFLFLVFIASCKKTENTNKSNIKNWMEIPEGFPMTKYNPVENPISENGFNLGKKIFYDTRLSKTGTVSCGSCHKQSFAFSDAGNKVSKGIENRLGRRNSPALFNVAWYSNFMADGGITHLEIMPLAPFTDTNEMSLSIAEVVHKMEHAIEYAPMFEKAFGTAEITDQRVYWALAQFMSALVSADSKYDRYLKKQVDFSATELAGLQVFNLKCSNCHTPPLFTNLSYKNNGLELNSTDVGRFRITQKEEDRGLYKVPSLRNIAVTFPYMHNGNLNTLEEVLQHYSSNIQANPNLSAELRNMQLSKDEMNQLYSFLLTLTDETFLNNDKFKP